MSNQPHDGLFRRIFGDLEHATALLQAFLPAPLAQAVDFATLKSHSNRFVNKKLRKSESDLIFSAKFENQDRDLFLYFLVEHQSYPDKWMPLRLLLYVGEAYDWCRRQNSKAEKLPLVFPIVLYHGGRKWNAPINFRELVDLPEDLQSAVQAFVPDFVYRLEDLSLRSDEELRQLRLTACAKAVLNVLKHAFDKDLADKLPEVLGDLTHWLATIKGPEELILVLRYVIEISESVDLSYLEKWRERLSPKAARLIMTLADQLRAEGEAKGRVEGRSEGLVEGEARALINIFTARGLDVSDETRRTIFSCRDASILDRWLRRALTVDVSSDVFRDG